MLRNRMPRRLAAGALIVLGAVLMFLATEVWIGVLLLLLGLALEVAGIALERRD
ncbi:MAG: hypothetical protein AB1418_12825 [Pseudomonadota bacterium]